MQQTCAQCQASFEVTDDDLAFLAEVSPSFNGKKELIPSPTLCPLCRTQRRMAWRNHCFVYRNPDASPQHASFSMWTPESPFPAYENSLWFSDNWEPHASAAEIDLSRPFFDQFMEVHNRSPRFALDTVEMENSDFCNNADHCKNCYLCFNASQSEDCIACDSIDTCRDCIDCTIMVGCERCADCINCERCYELQSSVTCENCRESYFLLRCRGCRHCIGCVNLRQREYCIFNEQKTPEEFAALAESFSSWAGRRSFAEKFDAYTRTQPRPHCILRMVEGCSGNYLIECNDVQESAFVQSAEHLRNCQMLFKSVNHCRDVTLFGIHAEYCYEGCILGLDAVRTHFCVSVWGGTSDMLYCVYCVNCSDCFGCTGLHRKKYCILNRQYTKEEYEELVPRIIEHMRSTGEWGEFFPIQASPVPYNHSLAQSYFPLRKQEVLDYGYRWREDEQPDAMHAINVNDLPDHLPTDDRTLVLKSSRSNKPFKLTSQEIKRYRQFHVPLPRESYDERIAERLGALGGIHFYDRTCMKTGKPIRTTIPPDSPWIVWDREVWEGEFGS